MKDIKDLSDTQRVLVGLGTAAFKYLAVLSLLFIGLKLTGHIDWTWARVTSPLWVSWGLYGVLYFVALFFNSLSVDDGIN